MRKCWLNWILPSVLILGLLSTPSPGQIIQQDNDLVIGKIFNLSSKILGEERLSANAAGKIYIVILIDWYSITPNKVDVSGIIQSHGRI